MAFGFFRRRQKMVLIIMAVLMVSFLVGVQGFDQWTKSNPANAVIGKMGDVKIKAIQLQQAREEMQSLESLGAFNTPDFLTMRSQSGETGYMLLLAEAQKAGIRVSDSEVASLLDKVGKASGGNGAADVYAKLPRDTSHKMVNSAIAHWLMIQRNYQANVVLTPPSESDLKHLYRDLNEQINARMITVSADEFRDKVTPPDEAGIKSQFETYRSTIAKSYDKNPFGFGYRQPNRAAIQYLLVNQAVVERVTQPTLLQLQRYYRDHQAEFNDKNFSDVREEIAAKLAGPAIASKIESVLSDAEKSANELANPNDLKASVYEQTRARMVLDAKDILGRTLKEVRLDDDLDKAIQKLAEQADLDAICYPWSAPGNIKIDPKVHVKLVADNITLGDALQKITDMVTMPQSTSQPKVASTPRLNWVSCRGFERAIFPVGDKDLGMLPIVVGQSGLQDAEAMYANPLLGMAGTGTDERDRGTPLLQMVFTAKPFIPKGEKGEAGAVKLGDFGPRMTTSQGRMLWRLSEAKPSYEPTLQDLASDTALRARVIDDCRDEAAFKLAQARATELMQQAQSKPAGLQAVAAENKLKTEETKLFTRKIEQSPRSNYLQNVYVQILQRQMSGQALSKEEEGYLWSQANLQASQYSPLQVVWQSIPGLTVPLQSQDTLRQMMEGAFRLAPKNPEPPYKNDKPAITMVDAKPLLKIAVMERIDYKPAVVGEFQAASPNVAQSLVALQEFQSRGQWFNLDLIQKRVKYQPETGKVVE